jgi:hypothetical protein
MSRRAVNVARLDGLHECHRVCDPRLEIGKGLLPVVMFRHFHTCKPGSGSLGRIGCNLDLPKERKHVRGKPVIEQHFWINLAVPGIGPRLCPRSRRGYSTFWRKAGTEGHRRGPLLVEEGGLSAARSVWALHRGENWIYEVDLGETFSCGQSNSMRVPYETVSAATAGTSHGFVWAPYATIVDSRNQTIGRRYNPEMIQIRKLVDWIFSERRFGF